jgi:hypothetical protein
LALPFGTTFGAILKKFAFRLARRCLEIEDQRGIAPSSTNFARPCELRIPEAAIQSEQLSLLIQRVPRLHKCTRRFIAGFDNDRGFHKPEAGSFTAHVAAGRDATLSFRAR